MKKITLFLLFLPFVISCHSQIHLPLSGQEFTTENNGLMYPDTTMNALRHMVDSLNIRFKSCSANPAYYSRPQGAVWIVRFASAASDLKEVRRGIDNKLGFSDLVRKYKQFVRKIDTLQTVIKFTVLTAEDETEQTSYLVGTPLNGYDSDYEMSDEKHNHTVGKWVFTYSPKDKYDSLNELECRYLPSGLAQKQLPQEYANYIAYVDCMIDTSAVICQAAKSERWNNLQKITEVDDLNSYLNRKMKLKPSKKENERDSEYLTEEKCKYANGQLKNDQAFINLAALAADACIENNTGSDMLEDLIANFVSKQKALDVKRHRRVVGLCSQDQSPRFHASNIAVLAAETNSWDIFLRAHMDIMNDRFERRSDGSYAYGRRQTYLKELEVLNLNIVDLMIGLSLRAENTASNHYNGTVWRLGRALSESKDWALYETKAIQMMKDDRLDDFNRGLMYIQYQSYLYSIQDKTIANNKISMLKKDAPSFPGFISKAINQLKKRTDKEDE